MNRFFSDLQEEIQDVVTSLDAIGTDEPADCEPERSAAHDTEQHQEPNIESREPQSDLSSQPDPGQTMESSDRLQQLKQRLAMQLEESEKAQRDGPTAT